MSFSQPFQIVRAERDADIRSIAPLFDDYRVFYGQPSDEDASYRFLRERWIARESILFIALGRVADPLGFVHLYPLFVSDRMLRLWLLNDLFVRPEARRSGLGRALMQRAEEHARETGSAGLTLSTAVDNTKAQGLYESDGYVRDDAFLHYNRFF
ncbi:MAG TPA: GNAT family N-acetyltransferase [Candidatus Tumulicola sp.]|jgi:ribosomal protein S18 acetylase RimI-like enzyme